MTKSIDNLLRFIASEPWAIIPEKLEAMVEFLVLRAEGRILTRAEIDARIGEPARGAKPGASSQDGVAVIPLVGIISQRAAMVDDMSGPGGTSTERFGRMFDQAMADETVRGIVLDVDSPGGSVSGVPETAAKVFAARGKKPVVAVVNSLMASAAYYIASAADEIVTTPAGMSGSIGVYTVHDDLSGAFEKFGVKRNIIKAGKFKAEGADGGPLPDEARAAVQQMVDDVYELFVSAVAKHRSTTASAVRDGYGEGRVLTGQRAIDAGLADRIGTLEETIARVGNPRRAARIGRHAETARRKLQLAANDGIA